MGTIDFLPRYNKQGKGAMRFAFYVVDQDHPETKQVELSFWLEHPIEKQRW